MRQVSGAENCTHCCQNQQRKKNQPFLPVQLNVPSPHFQSLEDWVWVPGRLQKCQHSAYVRKGRSSCPSAIFYEKSPRSLSLTQGRAIAGPSPRYHPGKRRWPHVTVLRSGPVLRSLISPSSGASSAQPRRTPTWRPQPAHSRLGPHAWRSDWPRAAGAAPKQEAIPPKWACTRRELAATRAAP